MPSLDKMVYKEYKQLPLTKVDDNSNNAKVLKNIL